MHHPPGAQSYWLQKFRQRFGFLQSQMVINISNTEFSLAKVRLSDLIGVQIIDTSGK
jgi:hypothetical protein